MTRAHLFSMVSVCLGPLLAATAVVAQSGDQTRVELIARAGTPLRVALDQTIALRRVGQVVRGTLVEPLYAYDRVVLPVGAHVVGHVAALEQASKLVRLRA